MYLSKQFSKWLGISVVVSATCLGFISSDAWALNCQQTRQLTGVYFKMHFAFNDFDDELSRRTLENFLKQFDPGKVYFLQADIDRLNEAYSTKLDDMLAQANCKSIDDVINTFSQRFEERQKSAIKSIGDKHDFTIDEYLDLDRKKMQWAKTSEEANERMRKRVKFQLLQLKDSLGSLAKAQEKLVKRFQLSTKHQNELTADDVYSQFLNAFAMALDPHSDYMSPDSLEDFRIQTRLSLEGIGAVLRSEDGFTTIQSLVPGGAAATTGMLKNDDKIIAVAQGKGAPVDVIDMELREVVKLIRGPRATEVRLTVMREETDKSIQLVVPVVREKVKLTDRAAKSSVHKVEASEATGPRTMKIVVLQLPSFYMDFEGRQNRETNFTSSSADVAREIKKLKAQNVDGIVVDLRMNGGGSLDEAINIAGEFLGKGPMVQTRAQDGAISIGAYKLGDSLYDGPLSVIISRQSASASEIFAGAIQDYGRGLIIGNDHTFGKGTVQNLTDIDEKLGAIKVTISKFYRPSGSSTQLRGVESDIVIPDLLGEFEIGEKHYDFALPWEKIKDSEFKNLNLVTSHVPLLRTASHARVGKDPGFKKVIEDIKTYKDGESDRNRVSLKEKSVEDKKTADKDDKKKSAVAGKGGKADKLASKDTKEKKGEKDKKNLDPEDPDAEMKIEEDFTLQESVRITADYVQLLSNRNLAEVKLPDVPVYKPDTVAEVKPAAAASNDKWDPKVADTKPDGAITTSEAPKKEEAVAPVSNTP